MRAEFLKVRSLPTPFWTGVTLGVFFLIGVGFSIFKGVGQDQAVLDLAIAMPTAIASLVFGAWLVGVEFGQGTLRRVLGSDPRRIRLVLAKLGCVVVTVTVVTVSLWLLGMVVFSFAGAGHDTLIHMDQALRNGAAALMTNLVYALVAMGLAWITRSMAGGMMVAFAFFFVIDVGLLLVPGIKDYTLGTVVGNLTDSIRGDGGVMFGSISEMSDITAGLVLAAWILVITGLGALRTKVTEVR